MSGSVEYRRTFLAALAAVMAGGDCTLPPHPPRWAPLEEPVRLECLDMLLSDVEDQRGGPEFLSLALYAATLLLSLTSVSRSSHVLLSFFYCSIESNTVLGHFLPAALTSFFLCVNQSKDIRLPAVV